jgi:hypothetical protein
LRRKKRGSGNRRLNPFEKLTGIKNRSYSKRCQKLITDFGIEESFGHASNRMKEHHGVDIPVSSVRHITEKHAARSEEYVTEHYLSERPSKQMIIEMDGEMVPLVEYENSKDKRKTKRNLWSELRIGVVQNHNEIEWGYACSFKNADQLGVRLLTIMQKKGLNLSTDVHGVGDGAKWIIEQGDKIAGSKFKYTIDLYHLCEYLAKAVSAWKEETSNEVRRFKKMLKEGKCDKVVRILKRRQKEHPKHEGIKSCIKYIKNRPGQFCYRVAIEKNLPIGSGKVESTHRSLMQKRLKNPGTWWLKENAEKMANLRTLRANGCWGILWQENFSKKSFKEAA